MSTMDVGINQRWSTALEVPVQGQSVVKTGQSLVQSLVHKNVNFGDTTGKEVVMFFNQTLQGSYCELFEWIVFGIGPEAIWKNVFFHVDPLKSAMIVLSSCLPLTDHLHAVAPIPCTCSIGWAPLLLLSLLVSQTAWSLPTTGTPRFWLILLLLLDYFFLCIMSHNIMCYHS